MTNPVKWVGRVIGFALMLSLVGCGQPDKTPEQQIRGYIANGEQAVKERDLLQIKALISDHYQDARGRDKRALTSLVAGYLFRNKNIHILTRITDIQFPQPGLAEAVLLTGMAADPAGGFESLLAIRADIYVFKLKLVFQDEKWLLQHARWHRAKKEDLISIK